MRNDPPARLVAVAALALLGVAACEDDADPVTPTPSVSNELAPAGTDPGAQVGEIDEPVDDDITGGGADDDLGGSNGSAGDGSAGDDPAGTGAGG